MSKIIIFLWMLIFSVLSYAAQEEDSGISFKILGVTACSKNGDTFMLAKAIITNNRKEKYRLMIRQDDILNYEWVAGFNVLTDIYIDDKPVYGFFGGVYNYSTASLFVIILFFKRYFSKEFILSPSLHLHFN